VGDRSHGHPVAFCHVGKGCAGREIGHGRYFGCFGPASARHAFASWQGHRKLYQRPVLIDRRDKGLPILDNERSTPHRDIFHQQADPDQTT
jgi:hypothetical protein